MYIEKNRQAFRPRGVLEHPPRYVIYLLMINARARRALGAILSKRMSLPSACPRVVGLFAPLCRPRANIHRLCCAPGALQKSTHFWDPSKSTTGVTKSAGKLKRAVICSVERRHPHLYSRLSHHPWPIPPWSSCAFYAAAVPRQPLQK